MADDGAGSRLRKFRPGIGFWALVTGLVLLTTYFVLLAIVARPEVTGTEIRFDQFLDAVEQDRVIEATILDRDSAIDGLLETADGEILDFNTPYIATLNNRERLVTLMTSNRVPVTINQQPVRTAIVPVIGLIPALLVAIALIYLVLSYRQNTGLFSSSKRGLMRVDPEDVHATFADVAAQDDAVREMKELAAFIAEPERFLAVGARIPKGVLLYGPPGCGKTLLARALANETGAAFYEMSGSDFVELYVGVGAARVRELFDEAREHTPAIIFIDELDALGQRRSASGPRQGSRDEQSQALNQILTELDGFSQASGVVVVGATNRPDVLDPALLRPGRFDRSIALERPGKDGRRQILAVHTAGTPLADEVDLDTIALKAVGMTGADLANVVNEAALLAAREHRTELTQLDLELATTQMLEAPERQRRLAVRDRSLGSRGLEEDRVTFADVAGVEEAITELSEIRDQLADPDRYARMGARVPRGYLLLGPPGTGKTLLARAVANEANATFISVSASEFTEVYVGEGAGRVRDLFAEARVAAPTVLFIDEIDAVGARRGSSGDSHGERDQTLNQILVELDGFSPRTAVVVLAASNRADILDPALVRPGRFDRVVRFGMPDRAGRRGILDVHARGKTLADDVDLDAIASTTRGMSGAELASIMNEASLLAARRHMDAVTAALVEEAMDRVRAGIGRAAVMSEDERRMAAYHEAGHALAMHASDGGVVPQKLTIIASSGSLGATHQARSHDRLLWTRSALIDELARILGGRVAEQLALGEPGSGSAADLDQASELSRSMVAQWGMSEKVGAMTWHDRQPSPGTSELIDAEVRALIAEGEARATTLLKPRRKLLDTVANALLEREVLTREDFQELVGPN